MLFEDQQPGPPYTADNQTGPPLGDAQNPIPIPFTPPHKPVRAISVGPVVPQNVPDSPDVIIINGH